MHELHIASNCKENPKELFGYIREKKTSKSNIGPPLSAEGEIVTDESETTDILNDYFASVFIVEEDRGEEAIPYQMTVAAQLFLVDITEEDVMHVVDSLRYVNHLGQIKSILEYLRKLKKQSVSHLKQFSIYPCELENL